MDDQQSTSGGGTKRSAEEASFGAPDNAATTGGGDGHNKRPRTAHGQQAQYANVPGDTANGVVMNGTAGHASAAVENGEVKVEDEQAFAGTTERDDDDGNEEDAKLPADPSSSSRSVVPAIAGSSSILTSPFSTAVDA